MKQFLNSNSAGQPIPTEKIDSYISYMSQVYNVQQYMLIQAQNQIMQAQLLKLQTVAQNQSSVQQQRIVKMLEQILQRGSQIQIKDFLSATSMPILAKYIANIILYIIRTCYPESDEQINNYIKNPNSIVIDQKQWDLICEIISNKLVYLGSNDINCTNDSQIGIVSQSLLFSGIIRGAIFKKLHTSVEGGNSSIALGTLNELLGEESRAHEFLYKFLCEEEKSTLTKDVCLVSLEKMFQKSGQYFHSSNLIEQIIENQKQFNTSGNFECHAQKYLNVIKIYKNSEENLVELLLNGLFGNKDAIECSDFIINSNRLNEKLKSSLFMFVDLVRIENSIIQIVLENKVSDEPQKNPLDYYAKLIEKIKNKCRSKEDEFCNCKRCQCIKRNRNSAREAQKRKREALEKIGPLQQEYETIQKKVKIIEFDNLKLKSILQEAMRNPIVSNLIQTEYYNLYSTLNFDDNCQSSMPSEKQEAQDEC